MKILLVGDTKTERLIMMTYLNKFGYLEGDDCLKKVATALRTVCKRTTDVVARYGGEGFALILTDTSPRGAEVMGEAVRRAVEDLQIPHAYSSVADVCTVSVGVYTCIPQQSEKIGTLLEKADAFLYQAKEGGRNRVDIGYCELVATLQS